MRHSPAATSSRFAQDHCFLIQIVSHSRDRRSGCIERQSNFCLCFSSLLKQGAFRHYDTPLTGSTHDPFSPASIDLQGFYCKSGRASGSYLLHFYSAYTHYWCFSLGAKTLRVQTNQTHKHGKALRLEWIDTTPRIWKPYMADFGNGQGTFLALEWEYVQWQRQTAGWAEYG